MFALCSFSPACLLVSLTASRMGCIESKKEQEPMVKELDHDDSTQAAHYVKDPTSGKKPVSRSVGCDREILGASFCIEVGLYMMKRSN